MCLARSIYCGLLYHLLLFASIFSIALNISYATCGTHAFPNASMLFLLHLAKEMVRLASLMEIPSFLLQIGGLSWEVFPALIAKRFFNSVDRLRFLLSLCVPALLSDEVGVGRRDRSINSVLPSLLHTFRPCVCAVGNNPHPVSSVWRANGTSRNNKRLD